MKTAKKIERLISWVDHQFKDELIAPGVTRNGCHWGVLFEGKRDALIAAGIAGSDWFSDCTERNKRGFIVRQKRFVLNGREVKTGVPADGRCTVSISYTEQEREDCYGCSLKTALSTSANRVAGLSHPLIAVIDIASISFGLGLRIRLTNCLVMLSLDAHSKGVCARAITVSHALVI